MFPLDYAGLATVTVAFGLFWHAALPQFEAVTLYHLKAQTNRYSQIRLWGSVGFIAAVLSMGRFLDEQPISYLPALVVILLTANWIIAMFVPDVHPDKRPDQQQGIGAIIRTPEVLVFLLVSMILQIAHAPYYAFYSLYLKQHQYSSTLTGGLWALGVAAEILLFLIMSKLLKRYSLRSILLCSIALGMVRWLLVAHCADSLPTLVFAQLLHAATFGGVHVTSIHLIHRYFGDRHQGKGQALFGSVSYGLGGMIGGIYSGQLWQAEGGGVIYSISAFCCALALLLGFVWIGRENSQKANRLG
ncbi:hypothetical protein JCM14076_05280 [Methylosoma difficile]